jgi:hypothetical protein
VAKKLKVAKRKLVTNISECTLLRKVVICATQKWRNRIWSSGSTAFSILGVLVTCSYALVLSVLECKNNAREQQEQMFWIHSWRPWATTIQNLNYISSIWLRKYDTSTKIAITFLQLEQAEVLEKNSTLIQSFRIHSHGYMTLQKPL